MIININKNGAKPQPITRPATTRLQTIITSTHFYFKPNQVLQSYVLNALNIVWIGEMQKVILRAVYYLSVSFNRRRFYYFTLLLRLLRKFLIIEELGNRWAPLKVCCALTFGDTMCIFHHNLITYCLQPSAKDQEIT